MAAIKFTAADVMRLLHLPNALAVEGLVAARVLEVSAYTRRGRPLFDVDSVRRAADSIIMREETRSA